MGNYLSLLVGFAMDVTLVTVEGSKKLQSLKLRSEETIVGRRDGCDLRIPSPGVSRRHCRLSFRDDLLTVEDLASANGTYLNGQRVGPPGIVRPGDRLEIGPVTFLVEYVLTPAAAARLAELPARVEAIPEMDAAVVQDDEEVLQGIEVAGEDDEVLQGVLVVDDQETVPDADRATGTDFNFRPPAADKKKKQAQPAPKKEEAPDTSAVMRDWALPDGGDLRDILEQLGDGKKG